MNEAVFKLHSDYKPTGDQPEAIASLTNGILRGDRFQTLLGVTGSGWDPAPPHSQDQVWLSASLGEVV